MKNAYYTVEATFVMTICISIIMLLIYGGFYVHDRVIVKSEMNEIIAEHFQEEITSEQKQKVKKYLDKKLWLLRIEQIQLTKHVKSIEMKLTYPLPALLSKFRLSSSIEITQERIKPTKDKWDYDIYIRKES